MIMTGKVRSEQRVYRVLPMLLQMIALIEPLVGIPDGPRAEDIKKDIADRLEAVMPKAEGVIYDDCIPLIEPKVKLSTYAYWMAKQYGYEVEFNIDEWVKQFIKLDLYNERHDLQCDAANIDMAFRNFEKIQGEEE